MGNLPNGPSHDEDPLVFLCFAKIQFVSVAISEENQSNRRIGSVYDGLQKLNALRLQPLHFTLKCPPNIEPDLH